MKQKIDYWAGRQSNGNCPDRSAKRKKKKNLKSEESSTDLWDNIKWDNFKWTNIWVIGVPE